MPKKVLVSGCFDVLHSGHIAFFEEAAQYGDLYVSVGSDANVKALKNRDTLYTEEERLYMVAALRVVKGAYIATGMGKIDFLDVIKDVQPDIFFVNSDGDSPEKRQVIENLGIQYIVSERRPKPGLPERSTTSIRKIINK